MANVLSPTGGHGTESSPSPVPSSAAVQGLPEAPHAVVAYMQAALGFLHGDDTHRGNNSWSLLRSRSPAHLDGGGRWRESCLPEI